MNAKLLIPFIAATLFSVSAHAHDCSGGSNGGMDATGNECSDVTTVATVASSDGVKSAPLPKVDTNKAASYNVNAVRHTSATSRTSARSRVKHG